MKKPIVNIIYDGEDITKDVTSMLLSVSYTDNLKGETDEIEIEFEDRKELWINDWYPAKGDSVSVLLGYDGEKLLDCGKFSVDSFNFRGDTSGSKFGLKAVATGFKSALRERKYKTHENKSFKKLVNEIASKHGLEVVGNMRDVSFTRRSQKNESDLSFLYRIAFETGHAFKVTDSQIVFYDRLVLDAASTVATLERKNIISYDISDETLTRHKTKEVRSFNPISQSLISSTESADFGVDAGKDMVFGGHDSIGLASSVAGKKDYPINGRISLPGDSCLQAGLTIELKGIGKLAGTYGADKVRHKIDSGGYVTELEVHKC